MHLVFSLGGTHFRVGLSQTGTSLDSIHRFPSPPQPESALKILSEVAASASSPIKNIVGSIAGTWDHGQHLVFSPNLPRYLNFPFKEQLSHQLSAPVKLFNDAALEGLGEASSGAGSNFSHVAYVCLGTGLGGSLVIDHKLVPTAWGFEPGQMLLPTSSGSETWENLSSGPALSRKYSRPPADISDPEVWVAEAQQFAVGLHNLTVLWSPEVFVIGGSVGARLPLFTLNQTLQSLLTSFPQAPQIFTARLGDTAGLIGALTLL